VIPAGLNSLRSSEIEMGELFQPWHILFLLFVFSWTTVLWIPPCWKIFEREGFHPALSLLMMVPVAGLVVLYIVAFSRPLPARPE
jgi:hypothetical protein